MNADLKIKSIFFRQVMFFKKICIFKGNNRNTENCTFQFNFINSLIVTNDIYIVVKIIIEIIKNIIT